MKGWLVLPIGVGLAVVAGWVLLSGPSGSTRAKNPDTQVEMDEIGQESREQLREILRRADEDGR